MREDQSIPDTPLCAGRCLFETCKDLCYVEVSIGGKDDMVFEEGRKCRRGYWLFYFTSDAGFC